MPKRAAEPFDLESTQHFFRIREGFEHIRVRKHGDLLVLESGPKTDPVQHARLRRVTRQWWTLEVATHTGQWQSAGLRHPRMQVLEALVADFPWVLTPIAKPGTDF